jgi:hypothetical protein
MTTTVELFSAHATGDFSRTGLHDLADFRLGRFERGEETEDHSAKDRQAHAEKQSLTSEFLDLLN